MAINFEEQIKLLIELQGLDSHIFKLEDIINGMPVKTKELEDKFKEKSNGLKALEDGVKALQLKRKEKEGDLETKEGVIKKYQSQLFQVKTNKEYSALEEEIGRVKADNSVLEEDIIKILEQIDVENQKIAKEKGFLKQEESSLNEEKKKLSESANQAKGELEGLKKQRAELAAKVDKTMLSKYDRLLGSRDAVAVVAVANGACQGCYRVLPPQVINEIKMKQDLIFCEHCARILYIEE